MVTLLYVVSRFPYFFLLLFLFQQEKKISVFPKNGCKGYEFTCNNISFEITYLSYCMKTHTIILKHMNAKEIITSRGLGSIMENEFICVSNRIN